jgi:hypothetical protein
MLRDTGTVERQDFVGDGLSSDYYLLYVPIDTPNEIVYLDGAETLDYALDDETGQLTFITIPTDGMVITVLYKTYLLTTLLLVEYIERACLAVNDLIATIFALTGDAPATTVAPDPTDAQREIILLMAMLYIKRDDVLADLEGGYSWRTEDVAVSRASGRIRDALGAKQDLEKDIQHLIWNYYWHAPSHEITLTGGFVPLEAGDTLE